MELKAPRGLMAVEALAVSDMMASPVLAVCAEIEDLLATRAPQAIRGGRDRLALREQPGTLGRQVLPDAQAPQVLPEMPGLLGRRARTAQRRIPALRVPQAVQALRDLRVLPGRMA